MYKLQNEPWKAIFWEEDYHQIQKRQYQIITAEDVLECYFSVAGCSINFELRYQLQWKDGLTVWTVYKLVYSVCGLSFWAS